MSARIWPACWSLQPSAISAVSWGIAGDGASSLDPIATIHLLLLQILHRNTSCAHLPRLVGFNFTPSAYCQAHSRLPLFVL